jgi:hypothetical protein
VDSASETRFISLQSSKFPPKKLFNQSTPRPKNFRFTITLSRNFYRENGKVGKTRTFSKEQLLSSELSYQNAFIAAEARKRTVVIK